MRRSATVAALLIVLGGSASAADAVISPNSPDNIVLKDSNGYEVEKQFDGTASTPDSVTYSWQWVEASRTGSGPLQNFTFTRDDPESNTVKLVVSNSSSSDSTSVIQNLRDVPNATVSANTTSVDLSDESTVKFTSTVHNTFSRPSGSKVDYEWFVDGSSENTSSSFSYSFGSTGDYTIKLNVSDADGYSSTESLTVSVTDSSQTQEEDEESTGGGGGGGFSTVSEEDVPVSRTLRTLEAGIGESFDIFDPDVPVDTIALDVSRDLTNVLIEVDAGNESFGTPEPEGMNYRFLEITKNMSDDDLEGAEITFNVRRNWLERRNVSRSEVVLKRYSGETWEELETTFVSGDEEKLSFSATTPGFSVFAISTRSASGGAEDGNQTAETTENSASCGDLVCDGSESWRSCSTDCSKPPAVVQAEEAVSNASSMIASGERGYETLQEAEAALENGSYEAASELALQALEENGAEQGSGSPLAAIGVLIGVLFIASAGGIAYWKRDLILSTEKKRREVAAATSELKRELKQKNIEHDVKDNIRKEIGEMEEDIQEGEYEDAGEHLENAEEELGEDLE